MRIEYCPRCGTRRDEYFHWCKKCGLDFEKAERGEVPRDAQPSPGFQRDAIAPKAPPPVGGQHWQQPYIPTVEVRPATDRQTMARWSAHALDVRCGGTAGGCLGMLAGFLLGATLGAAMGGPLLALAVALLGTLVGLYVGMRVALGMMAR